MVIKSFIDISLCSLWCFKPIYSVTAMFFRGVLINMLCLRNKFIRQIFIVHIKACKPLTLIWR